MADTFLGAGGAPVTYLSAEGSTMRKALLFRLLGPAGAAIAGQLSRPRGWLGRTVMTRVLNLGNRDLIEATLDGLALAPGCRLLDVGFGGGLLLELAYRRGVRRLAGVDPSEAAIAFLRSRPGRLEGAELVLELGVVEALPFADASFDVVASGAAPTAPERRDSPAPRAPLAPATRDPCRASRARRSTLASARPRALARPPLPPPR
jgi:SAM-dependent methyltransferase